MTVCKFFLQGNCRYGSSCKFEHPRNQSRDYRFQSQSQNFQSYPRHQDQRSAPKEEQNEEFLSQNEFLEHIRNDMSTWINSSPMWKLSCYTYSKSASCIPVLHDISPEEARFSLYEARAKNSLPQAINEYNIKLNETINIIKQMINPNQQIREYLLNYFNQCEKSKSAQPSENPFLKIVQQKQIEQIQPQQQNKFAQLVMHQPKPQTQANVFGSGFGAQFAKPTEPFKASSFNLASANQAFQEQTANPMETNFFSNIVQMNTEPTQTRENTFFGQNLPLKKQEPLENKMFYSEITEINKQDLDEFKSNEFTIGRIPNVPPAKELC